MPSELIEFLWFTAILLSVLSLMALTDWIFKKVSSKKKSIPPYIISDDRRFIR